jgi:RHS repeat-associated protein
VARLEYNEASLLDNVKVNLRGAERVTPFATNITYNPKAQRESIAFGNGARTHYTYDPLTFRLIHLRTTRTHGHAHLQDLKYTYDPIGNITSIADHAQQTVYFDNQVVSPSNDYRYDAIYRLFEAHGREHIGLLARPEVDWNDEPRMNQPQPGDGQAMRRYQEDYQYDLVGNILSVIHHAADGGWRRYYDYSEFNNRLERTRVGELKEHYAYDANGNMVRMPHLPLMDWDFKNQLHVTREQVVNHGDGQRTFYVYDSAGQRVRKITERPDGSRAHERIYLGGLEIYREYSRNKISLERETLHVMDDKRRIALVETKTIDIEAQPNHLPHVLIRYQFTNHLESTSLELDEEAAIISYEEYYPYGSTSYEAVRREVEISPKRYRFTGQERDEETGLYYHGARYYASWLGRWTAPDPNGLKDGPNLFAYCSDNPIGLRDPSGTDGEISTTPAEDEAQACFVDPSTPEPTAAEEAAQQSLPESERYEPPKTSSDVVPLTQGQANPSDTRRDPAAVAREQKYKAIFEQEKQRGFFEGLFHKNTPEEVDAHRWLSAEGCPECDRDAPPEELHRQLANYRLGLGLINANNALTTYMAMSPGAPVEAEGDVTLGGGKTLLPTGDPEVLDEAVAANRQSWAQLTSNSPSASQVFSVGQDLSATNELTIIEHGTARDIAGMSRGEVGAEQVVLSGVGKVGPDTLAEILTQNGWQGGQLRLIACGTGLPSEQGLIFGEQLSISLGERGASTMVAAPKGLVTVGSELFGTQAPVVVSPRVGVGVGAFNYYGP